jgi:hypothetical protein
MFMNGCGDVVVDVRGNEMHACTKVMLVWMMMWVGTVLEEKI